MSCHTFLTPGTILKNVRYQGWMFPIFELSPGFLYIARARPRAQVPLGKSFQLSAWSVFPVGSLWCMQKARAWEQTCKQSPRKHLAETCHCLSQFAVSMSVFLNDKPILNGILQNAWSGVGTKIYGIYKIYGVYITILYDTGLDM